MAASRRTVVTAAGKSITIRKRDIDQALDLVKIWNQKLVAARRYFTRLPDGKNPVDDANLAELAGRSLPAGPFPRTKIQCE